MTTRSARTGRYVATKRHRTRRNPGVEELVFEVVKGAMVAGASEAAKDAYHSGKGRVKRAVKRRRR